MWCGIFDPEAQKPICSPCAEKRVAIKSSGRVDSEATSPSSSVHSKQLERDVEIVEEDSMRPQQLPPVPPKPANVANDRDSQAWKARCNAVRKLVKCSKCPGHLQNREPYFHITSSSPRECVSCKCLHCMKSINPIAMMLAIKLAETR